MPKLLDQTDYDSQRGELERAIAYAEAEYHSASFKAQTGAGDAKGAKTAKDHLDALKASLEGLHAAWRGSEQFRADSVVAARNKAFANLTAEVDAALDERAAKLDAIVQAGEALAEAMKAHFELSRSLRLKILEYRNRHAPRANIDGVDSALNGGASPGAIAGAVLAANGIQTSLIGGNGFLFKERSAVEMEERQAYHVRAQLNTFAPKKEA